MTEHDWMRLDSASRALFLAIAPGAEHPWLDEIPPPDDDEDPAVEWARE